MSIDWSVITEAHVRQACEQFDHGIVVPSRPARNTVLVLNGKTYPAKFIRGLAYFLAIGKRLNPSVDYAGGQETVRFFDGLGLTTKYGGSSAGRGGHTELRVDPEACRHAPKSVPEPREIQKKSLVELVRRRFSTVHLEAVFTWLVVPPLPLADEPLKTIYDAIKSVRGIADFATPGVPPSCDFYIPSLRLLIEYDERQHFTLQRAAALEAYPSRISLGFDIGYWTSECVSIQASDPNPPHRDEQRAFYDSLRDILAVDNGYFMVRVKHGAVDWTAADAPSALARLLANVREQPHQGERGPNTKGANPMPTGDVAESAKAAVRSYLHTDPKKRLFEDLVRSVTTPMHPAIFRPLAARLREHCRSHPLPKPGEYDDAQLTEIAAYIESEVQKTRAELGVNGLQASIAPVRVDSPESLFLRRVALVSHDYNRTDGRGLWDYSEVFQQVNQCCDEQGCDTILYALHTWDRRSPNTKDHDSIFRHLQNVQRVILEVGELYSDPTRWAGNQSMEVWHREQRTPGLAWQWFASTSDMGGNQALVEGLFGDLVRRQIGDTVLVICGENGVISSGSLTNQQRFRSHLDQAGVKVILNPIHDRMRPYRGHDYFHTRMTLGSQSNRIAVSVWNLGKNKTEPAPWALYQNRIERTELVREVRSPIRTRSDLRIGIVDLR